MEAARGQRGGGNGLNRSRGRAAPPGAPYDTAPGREPRALVAAPLEGFIRNMRYHGGGWGIRPDEPVKEIVPAYDTVLIEARIHPRDIGHREVPGSDVHGPGPERGGRREYAARG